MAARKKKSQKPSVDVSAEIKAMEQAKREKAVKSIPKAAPKKAVEAGPKLVGFDEWFFRRKTSIPARHRKEILAADFKARGLNDKETIEKFDEALGQYGIKL